MVEHLAALGGARIAALVAATLLAGLIRGFTGFGSALVMAPAFALVVPPREAVVLITLLNLATMTQLLAPALKKADWPLVAPMSAAAVLTIPLGTWLLVAVDGDMVRRAIAIVVVAFALVLLAGGQIRIAPRLPATLAAGAVSGVLTGIGGIGGPPVVLYLLSRPSEAAHYRASFISYFAVIQVFGILPLLYAGLVEIGHLGVALALLPAYFAATWAGARLFEKAPDALYRRLAILTLLAVAIAALLA